MSPDVTGRMRVARSGLAGRLSVVRVERFGAGGVPALAREVGVPERTWLNYERGVTIPGWVLLEFVRTTSAEPLWLLTGKGPRYRDGAGEGGRGPGDGGTGPA